jgi:hypothetical protein
VVQGGMRSEKEHHKERDGGWGDRVIRRNGEKERGNQEIRISVIVGQSPATLSHTLTIFLDFPSFVLTAMFFHMPVPTIWIADINI